MLRPGECISYSTLLERLYDAGTPPRGMMIVLEDPTFIRRWRTGEVYSSMHVYESKDRGPLYVERAAMAFPHVWGVPPLCERLSA